MNKGNQLKIIQLRHELHRYPELSMHEQRTAKMLRKFIRENTMLSVVERDGWFYALKKGSHRYKMEDSDGRILKNSTEKEMTDGGSNTFCPPPIAFRADMDALPIPETIGLPYGSVHAGISHKCGHDGHCAALCGLALELDGMETDRDVYLLFQPGEEVGQGALLCRELLREKGIGEIYAFHNLGGYPEGSIVYRRGLAQPASEGLRIRLEGKASHASAPEKGLNPAKVLAQIVLFAEGMAKPGEVGAPQEHVTESLQKPEAQAAQEQKAQGLTEQKADGAQELKAQGMQGLQTQNLTQQEARDIQAPQGQGGMRLCTVTGIRLGNGDFGISPGEGELCLTLRAEEESEMLAMERSITAFAAEAASRAGLHMTHSIQDYFPETRNHDACLQRVLDAAAALNSISSHTAAPGAAAADKKPAIPMRELWRASEDFGYYLQECSGAMFYIGNGEDYPALHTAEYDFNDRILERAVDLFVRLV